MGDTFGGPHRRPDHSGQGHSQRDLQDRASFDCAPRAGVSCLLIALPISIALWAGLITAGHALIGAIA